MAKKLIHRLYLLNILTSGLGVLAASFFIPLPAFSQLNFGNAIPQGSTVTPNGLIVSPDRRQIITPSGTVTSNIPFTTNPDGSFTSSNGTIVTLKGLIVSPDRRQIITPSGTVPSNNPFVTKPDGSFTSSDGTSVTPHGLIVSPNRQQITTPSGTIASDIPFTTKPDGSFNSSNGTSISAKGQIVLPNVPENSFSNGQVASPNQQPSTTSKPSQNPIKVELLNSDSQPVTLPNNQIVNPNPPPNRIPRSPIK